MSTLIEAKGLSKSYGSARALDNVSFNVEAGRIVGLIGPNGAGKTTALKALLGLTPYDGYLRVAGLDPYRQRDALMQDVCFIADVAVLPRWIRVHQVVAFVEGVHPRFRADRCREFLSRTNIPPKAQVKTLSKGMVTQLHLAIAMAIDAKLLVLDEPTQGVDVNGQLALYDLIDQLRKELGCAVLMVSHDLHLVMAKTDEVLCLNQHICCSGAPEVVSMHPEFIAMFGNRGAEQLAVYRHHHNHRHDLQGRIVLKKTGSREA